MARLSLGTVSEMIASPGFVDGLTILYGSKAAAARKLGISAKRLGGMYRWEYRRFEPPDKLILDVQKGLNRLPAGDKAAVKAFSQIGDKFSPWQIRALRGKSAAARPKGFESKYEFREHFRKEVIRQARRYEIDFFKLVGSPKSKRIGKRK